jgi:hypothetical protein
VRCALCCAPYVFKVLAMKRSGRAGAWWLLTLREGLLLA